jgi:PAS domain S-box-containing protein
MRQPSKHVYELCGAAVLVAAILVGTLHAVWQYQALSRRGGFSALLLGGFLLTAGGLVFLFRRLIARATIELEATTETVARNGCEAPSLSLSTKESGSLQHPCQNSNQMADGLQNPSAAEQGQCQEIDDNSKMETVLTNSQHLWEKTFDAVPDLIAIMDDQHHIIKMNAAMETALGSKSAACQGKKCFAYVHGSNGPFQNCPFRRMLTTGEDDMSQFFEPTLNRWLEVRVSPLRDAEGTVVGGVHVARDIHAHKELEAKLATRNEELQQSVAALEAANARILEQQKQLIKEERLKALLQMAGATAHEMNQPLMALQGNIELMRHKDSAPERRAIHLERISEAGTRLASIVRKIQTLHHDEVRPYPGGLTIVDLHKVKSSAPCPD